MLKLHWIYKYQPRNYLNTVYCVTAVSNKREKISLDIEYLFSSFGYSEQISWILRDRHTRKRRKRMKILNFRKGIVSLMKLYFIICLWEKKRMKEGRDFCLDHSNFKRFEANKRNVLDDSTLLRQFCLVFGIIALCWYEVSVEDFKHFCFPCFLCKTHRLTVPDLMRSENLIEKSISFRHFIKQVPSMRVACLLSILWNAGSHLSTCN